MSFTAYHATSLEAAAAILKSGFRAGTYFAFRRRDAAQFGPVIFKVRFSGGSWRGESDGWQFHIREAYGTEIIVDVSQRRRTRGAMTIR